MLLCNMNVFKLRTGEFRSWRCRCGCSYTPIRLIFGAKSEARASIEHPYASVSPGILCFFHKLFGYLALDELEHSSDQ